jgi:D5 N terminal like
MGAAFDLASKLGGSKPNGHGGYKAFCPVHEADGRAHDPSLNIDDGEDGKLLVHCLVHCDQGRVVDAIKARGYWPSPNGKGPARALKSVATVWTPVPPTVDTPDHPVAHPKRGKPTALWTYRDADARPFTVDFRFDLPGAKKEVLPCTWAQSDRGVRAWRWMHSKPRPIYGLDRLAARPAAPVLLVSGAKCADVGDRVAPGYVSITWQGGDDLVEHVDWKALAGRAVTIWSDHDPSGIRSMRKAESRLKLLGCQVRFVQIPEGASVSWDIADAAAEGMSAADVVALIEGASETPPKFVKESSASDTPGKPGLVPEYSESALVDEYEQFCCGSMNHCRDHWNGWTGKQWRPADKLVLDFAETVARAAAGRALLDVNLKSAAESTARRVASAHTARAIESMARNRSSLSSEPKDWDANPLLLGTPDGVWDLETSRRLDPKREFRITKSTAVVPAETSDGAVQWLKGST